MNIGAVTFTNPWEVVKTRLQLQGEQSISKISSVSKPYGNAITAFTKILRYEGVIGLQKGLMPAYVYQILLNGIRLGMYEPLKMTFQRFNGTSSSSTQSLQAISMIGSGAISGMLGACIASPFYLIKTASKLKYSKLNILIENAIIFNTFTI